MPYVLPLNNALYLIEDASNSLANHQIKRDVHLTRRLVFVFAFAVPFAFVLSSFN
jgi:hypothetical protein